MASCDGERLRDADLFWALERRRRRKLGSSDKGNSQIHELPEFFGGAKGKIKAKSDESYRKLIARFVSFYRKALLNPHWGEQAILECDNTLKLSFVMQGMTGPQAREVWKPFFDWVKASSHDYSIVEELRAGAIKASRVVAVR